MDRRRETKREREQERKANPGVSFSLSCVEQLDADSGHNTIAALQPFNLSPLSPRPLFHSLSPPLSLSPSPAPVAWTTWLCSLHTLEEPCLPHPSECLTDPRAANSWDLAPHTPQPQPQAQPHPSSHSPSLGTS